MISLDNIHLTQSLKKNLTRRKKSWILSRRATEETKIRPKLENKGEFSGMGSLI